MQLISKISTLRPAISKTSGCHARSQTGEKASLHSASQCIKDKYLKNQTLIYNHESLHWAYSYRCSAASDHWKHKREICSKIPKTKRVLQHKDDPTAQPSPRAGGKADTALIAPRGWGEQRSSQPLTASQAQTFAVLPWVKPSVLLWQQTRSWIPSFAITRFSLWSFGFDSCSIMSKTCHGKWKQMV